MQTCNKTEHRRIERTIFADNLLCSSSISAKILSFPHHFCYLVLCWQRLTLFLPMFQPFLHLYSLEFHQHTLPVQQLTENKLFHPQFITIKSLYEFFLLQIFLFESLSMGHRINLNETL